MLSGWQHVSWGFAGNAAAQRKQQTADLRRAHDAGFGLMAFAHLGDVAHTKRLLDQAERWGVVILLEDVHPSERGAFGGHPALLALIVSDDANRRPPEELATLCADAPGPRYITIGPGAKTPHSHCYGLTELIAVQIYPLPAERLADYWPVLVRARQLADIHRMPLFANGQAYNPGERAPTPAEIRALGWMYAAAGCDGILWYAMQDTDNVRVTEEVWAAVHGVTLELRRVSGRPEVICNGDILRAEWAGGVRAEVDLNAGAVLSLTHRN